MAENRIDEDREQENELLLLRKKSLLLLQNEQQILRVQQYQLPNRKIKEWFLKMQGQLVRIKVFHF